MNRAARCSLVALTICGVATGLGLAACGSDSSTVIPGGDDAGADSPSTNDGNTISKNDGSVSDGSSTGANDAGIPAVPCAPPTDPTKAALCIQLSHDAIDFFPNDFRFDGVGTVVAQIFSESLPDYPDGGEEAAQSATTLPALDAGADAGFDLRNAIPVLRFDGLTPGATFPRVFFIDNPDGVITAGWWVAGLDFSGGFQSVMPLNQVTLTAGQGTGVAMNLTALRALVVDVTRSVDPEGDGQGTITVIPFSTNNPNATGGKIFGVATGCGNLSQKDASAEVTGFVIGTGPYYLSAALDDYGVAEAGSNAGELLSIDLLPDGSAQIPAANKTNYAATTYIVTQTVNLNLAVPKPSGGDNVQCP